VTHLDNLNVAVRYRPMLGVTLSADSRHAGMAEA
jgi:hypothetical protein